MTKSVQISSSAGNLCRNTNFHNSTTPAAQKKRRERSKKPSLYFEQHLLIAWLVSFIAAPLAVLGAVILTAAAIGGLMLAVL